MRWIFVSFEGGSIVGPVARARGRGGQLLIDACDRQLLIDVTKEGDSKSIGWAVVM